MSVLKPVGIQCSDLFMRSFGSYPSVRTTRVPSSVSMPCAGGKHSVYLLSDGSAVGTGANTVGQIHLPKPPEGVDFVKASAGEWHTILLMSNGGAIACGTDLTHEGFDSTADLQTCDPVKGIKYIQVSAGKNHSALLRDDGTVFCFGYDGHCRCSGVPNLVDPGVTFTQVSAGGGHTVLLTSTGAAVACGANAYGQCNIPELPEGMRYIDCSAGLHHTVLLRCDGHAVAFGLRQSGQCRIPMLTDDLKYTQVSAGHHHTGLLRSDGRIVFSRLRESHRPGQRLGDQGTRMPELPSGVEYVEVSCGQGFTLALRSDGHAEAVGTNELGQCRRMLPAGPTHKLGVYILSSRSFACQTIQFSLMPHPHMPCMCGWEARCLSLAGDELASWTVNTDMQHMPVIRLVAFCLPASWIRRCIVLPSGAIASRSLLLGDVMHGAEDHVEV